MPIAQVESIYTATFGIQTHINIADLLERNKIIQAAPHIVSVISNNKWMVWAPTGRPYPSRGGKTNLLPVRHSEISTPNSEVDITTEIVKTSLSSSSEEFKAIVTDRVTNVTEDIRPLSSSQLIPHAHFSQLSAPQNDLMDVSSSACENDTVLPFISAKSVSNDDDAASEDFSTELISKTVTSVVPSSVKVESSIDLPVSTNPALPKNNGEVSAETYGFLEKSLEPELMAELRASGEQHQQREQTLSELLNSKPLSEKAIQLLIHFAKPMSEIDLDDDSDGADDQEVQAEPDEPVDYLQSGMTPDQVLEEMRKLKERCGGYLSPEKMEPFLTYFGELSSRELDRLESLEEGKPKSKKGATKKKRVMAIRFPDKSPAPPSSSGDDPDPDPYKEQRLYSAELLKDKLPVAPDFENMSDSSDSEGCPRPFEREEYIQKLLERGLPSLTNEDIIRAAQVVGKEANRKPGNFAGAKVDWPSFEDGSEEDIINDLPKPLLSPSELGHAINCQLFDDSPLVLDPTSHTTAKSNATEWPDIK